MLHDARALNYDVEWSLYFEFALSHYSFITNVDDAARQENFPGRRQHSTNPVRNSGNAPISRRDYIQCGRGSSLQPPRACAVAPRMDVNKARPCAGKTSQITKDNGQVGTKDLPNGSTAYFSKSFEDIKEELKVDAARVLYTLPVLLSSGGFLCGQRKSLGGYRLQRVLRRASLR